MKLDEVRRLPQPHSKRVAAREFGGLEHQATVASWERGRALPGKTNPAYVIAGNP